MKHCKLIVALLLLCLGVHAQTSPAGATSFKKYFPAPSVTVLKTDSSTTGFKKLFVQGIPAVVLFFSPDCDHCQHQIKEITEHAEELKKINFIFVSNRPLFLLKNFSAEFIPAKCKNITLVQDTGNQLLRFYEVGGYPSMVIFNAEGKPVDKFVSSIVNKSGILFAVRKP